MIEFLKLVGAAIITASATLFGLFLQRKWKKDDVKEEKNEKVLRKLDELTKTVDDIQKDLKEHISENDSYVKESDIKRKCIQAGLREMLYDRIKYLSYMYEDAGEIREEEYKSLKRMWDVYHNDLEGNGYLDARMAVIEDLKKC